MDEMLSQMQNQNSDLQIVGPLSSTSTTFFSPPPSSSSSPPFELPSDWVLELRRRSNGRFDKYYYEPGTGRQFRSLSSIQKYLSGDIDALPKRLKPRNIENNYYEPGTGRKFRSLSSIQKYLSGDTNASPKRMKPFNGENMAVFPCIFKENTPFGLPDGWVVIKKPRNNINYAHVVDKYYYEPGTGRQFRSLLSVRKYLSGDMNNTPKRLRPHDRENGNQSFRLAGGWVVEEKPRNNINYPHVVDRTYIEPGTGKRFRSLISAERYIAEGKVCAAKQRPHQLYLTDMAEASNHIPCRSFHCETKQACGNKVEASIMDLGRPPANVKWVLSPVGSIWKPFTNDTPVPDSIQRKWSRASVHILRYAN